MSRLAISIHSDCRLSRGLPRPAKPIRLLGDLDALPAPVKVHGRGPAGKARRAARIASRAIYDAWKGITL